MSKVITFSTVFPDYHPKAGMPTLFAQKILNGLVDMNNESFEKIMRFLPGSEISKNLYGNPAEMGTKYTTIRAGHRWKKGDTFSPRLWSARPYYSNQITIAPDISITGVWDIEIEPIDKNCYIHIEGRQHSFAIANKDFEFIMGTWNLERLAGNDGLSVEELFYWLKIDKQIPFKGQIISWNANIKY